MCSALAHVCFGPKADIGDEVDPAQGLINNFTVASAYDAGANSIHSWIGFERL
jgi:hypothetical protein